MKNEKGRNYIRIISCYSERVWYSRRICSVKNFLVQMDSEI